MSSESVVDDPSIVLIFEQLYQQVRTWSSKFLADLPAALLLTKEEMQRVRHILPSVDISSLLENRSQRRKVIEGMVGYTISHLETSQGLYAFRLPVKANFQC
jgi:hypothetical protein